MIIETPRYLNIPVFFESGLYLPNTAIPTPKTETLISKGRNANLFSIGEYQKGPVFILKPTNPNGITIHLEHRSIHSPSNLLDPRPQPQLEIYKIANALSKRDETWIDKENYFKNVAPAHRLTQEIIRDNWPIISMLIDPSPFIVTPSWCFLEEGVDSYNGDGKKIDLPLDVVGISHSGKIFVIEVASRKKHDDIYRRSKKYKQVKINADLFRKQYGTHLNIVEACVFYEVLTDNTLYLSLRYPQEVK